MHADPKSQVYYGPENACFDEENADSKKVKDQMTKIADSFKEGSDDSVTRAIKEEIPQLNDIFVEFGLTTCGRTVFSKQAIDYLNNSSQRLRSSNVSTKKLSSGYQ